MAKPIAVVLLSGGLDSATTAAIAAVEGFSVFALSFDYGQLHAVELAAAARVAKALGVTRHLVVNAGLGSFGGSALTDPQLSVPKGRGAEAVGGDIPVTYVPARNTIFLSYALGWADVLDAADIFIGVNALDFSGYPDCRPEFIRAFEQVANLATRKGVEGGAPIRIHAPLIHMTKGEIIARGHELGVDYSLTSTCYDPDPQGRACGACDACGLRLKGFAENGIEDPIEYVSR
jgi:7-cyano-7-deazaguanine synthase